MQTFDIVFEAGGAKGVAFIGALEVLLGAGHGLGRLIGTSAGAITATCVAAGCDKPRQFAVSPRHRGDR